jgi:hypothetical protein
MADDPTSRLADLIDSVADGSPIDWDALERAATTESFRRLVRDLRTVAGVADVHRSQIDSEDQTTDRVPTVPAGAVGRWGNFLLVAKIGEGSFGEVFHAHDSWLDHAVALKLLKPQLVDPSRFLHEARTLVKVRHPNVVEVYGADLHEGRVGFWMELIRGHTLAQVVAREGMRSGSEAAIIGQDLCRALAAVHAAGIVHRDIKAQNVMRQAGTGRLVLMDFGAGEMIQTDARTPRLHLTGTPLYLAPELFDDDRATVQSDIYALGVLLFYLVTGSYPVQRSTLEDLVAAHARREYRRLADVRPDLSDDFVRVVDTMLAANPSDRYSTAGSARTALAAVVAPGHHRPELTVHAEPAIGVRRAFVWTGGLVMGAAAVTIMGAASTAAFDLTFGRTGGFGGESPVQWFIWGVRSLVSPIVRIGLGVAALTLLIAVIKVLCRVMAPLDAAAARVRWICQGFSRRHRLDDPTLLVQAVTGGGALAFALLAWVCWGPLTSFAIYINDAPADQLAALQPARGGEFDRCARLLEVWLFAYGTLMYSVYRNARHAQTAIPSMVTACAIGVPVLAVLLTREVPYRIVYQNDIFERVDLNEARCYEIGERPGEVLLHCPDLAPPRNQVVSSTDGRLRPRGIRESVFAPPSESRVRD